MSTRTMRSALLGPRWVGLLRVVLFALMLPIATSGAMPAWARLLGGPGAHVCLCSAKHHDCLCIQCDPDRIDLLTSDPALQGRCGDDESLMSGKAFRATVHSAPVFVPRAPITVARHAVVASPVPREPSPPPTPPPRA